MTMGHGGKSAAVILGAMVLLGAPASAISADPDAPVSSPLGRLEKVVADSHFDPEEQEPWRYLLYRPDEGQVPAPDGGYPLLLWLHGRSLRGDDLEQVRRYGPPSFLDERDDFPFLTVCPQLPRGGWPPARLDALLEELLESYPIDPDRVLLSGVSLGAMGAWGFAADFPDRFAGLVPVCAHGPKHAAKLTDLPIWAFHGALDDIVPIEPHRELAERIEENGGDIRFTEIPEGDHGNIIAPIYSDPALYEWLLEKRR
ncbi:MAG: phospholipase [Verrucomicrobiota bacterium]